VAESASKVEMRKTLNLTGVTVNAMALIAPGAFLWITYQLQAAQTFPGTNNTTAMDMWPGILFALILAFLTAISYSELARIYPEAGTGSCYYFAEKAFMDKEEVSHQRWARIAKLATGWAAHLFYWVYPGVMVAFMATLIAYIAGLFGLNIPTVGQIVIAILFAILVGYIGYRGVNGSTLTALMINVIQLVALVGFSVLAIAYRVLNPAHATFVHASALSVVLPHSISGVLFQSTIAILILVGFESCTAFGAEAINPKRDVPRAVLLALVIQGLIAYMFEYFAANFALSDQLVGKAADGSVIKGWDAAAASSAPIGDMIRLIGDTMLGGIGFGLTVVIAITVALAILGTTLSAMNTGVRITYAMAQDAEMPEPLGLLHGEFATPHFAIWVMVAVSAIIGAIGTVSVVSLTAVTLASNLGTFVLYGLTCVWTVVAFAGHKDFNFLKHWLVPMVGLIANLVMLVTIFFMGFLGGGDSQTESIGALALGAVWLVLSGAYVVIRNRQTGRSILAVSQYPNPGGGTPGRPGAGGGCHPSAADRESGPCYSLASPVARLAGASDQTTKTRCWWCSRRTRRWASERAT
jgi:APA family basic amino acid/polyamine antiporter